MRILVACEKSGRVRDAFIKRGHDAISCDILPSDSPGPHHQGRLEDFIGSGEEWDMIIAFPPCTYLCSSGLHWNKRRPERAQQTEYAIAFVNMIFSRKCKKIVVENPRGCISTRIRKPDQCIQPNQFGEDASKETCLWLKGVPHLVPTKYIDPRWVCSACKTVHPKSRFAPRCQCGAFEKEQRPRWANQTDSGQNKLGPSEERAMLRGTTYQGIADAMADQWS